MAALADFISRYYDRPLVDMTGLTGAYDMGFDVSAEEIHNAARAHGIGMRAPDLADAASDPSGASLPSSLQKLGLKLESRKAPAEDGHRQGGKIPSDN